MAKWDPAASVLRADTLYAYPCRMMFSVPGHYFWSDPCYARERSRFVLSLIAPQREQPGHLYTPEIQSPIYDFIHFSDTTSVTAFTSLRPGVQG